MILVTWQTIFLGIRKVRHLVPCTLVQFCQGGPEDGGLAPGGDGAEPNVAEPDADGAGTDHGLDDGDRTDPEEFRPKIDQSDKTEDKANRALRDFDGDDDEIDTGDKTGTGPVY